MKGLSKPYCLPQASQYVCIGVAILRVGASLGQKRPRLLDFAPLQRHKPQANDCAVQMGAERIPVGEKVGDALQARLGLG